MNLTPFFQVYINRYNYEWNLGESARVLEEILQCVDNAVIEWEKGDEEWGRIIRNKQVVALVCARFPLVIVLAGLKAALEKAISTPKVSLVSVESMSEKTYSVDKAVLEIFFGRTLSENVDYGKCSIDDLWWATV
jgi:hypothetical protein